MSFAFIKIFNTLYLLNPHLNYPKFSSFFLLFEASFLSPKQKNKIMIWWKEKALIDIYVQILTKFSSLQYFKVHAWPCITQHQIQ